ncbi:RNA binding S1 domain-containing protein [Streptococcus varani]|uniref:RNA binding S1 domain-containing protein n=1 Tax=Streptococcus varani TaxID=1608583 RepID=A0A0E4H5Z7_9STRE|nr:S1 RNA-binding domain-containing protein [Streptococcus varani]CQR25764.1 RNA binding S1 domain-containing protein [Streptococcus varani]
MKIGDKIQGLITGIQPYGAFVDLENQTRGLIHISEIKTGFVDNIHDVLKVGQKVLVQVVDYDEFSGKASLSLRTLEEEKQSIPRRHRYTNERNKIGFAPFVQQLPIWIKESKEFLQEKKEESETK